MYDPIDGYDPDIWPGDRPSLMAQANAQREREEAQREREEGMEIVCTFLADPTTDFRLVTTGMLQLGWTHVGSQWTDPLTGTTVRGLKPAGQIAFDRYMAKLELLS
jgi:hypothetical protein